MKPIITTICLIAAFGLMVFGIWPEYQGLREAMELSKIKETDRENANRYISALNEMTKQLENDYRSDVEKLEDGVPDDHYIPSLFSEIRRASYRTGVRVGSIGDFSSSDYQEREGVMEVEVDFQIEGAYSNFKNFISELEKNARIISIQNLSIEQTGSREMTQPLIFSVTILTYSY